MCTVHPQTAARAGVLFAALAVFLYILWLSNNSNRDAVQSLRSASANIRRSQYMQQELLNRVEYRLAATSSKYTELQRAFGEEFAASMAENRDSTHSLYQSTLQKAGAALKQADMETAVEMLTKTNHELLNKLNLVEQRRSGNSSSIRRVKDALAEEVGYPAHVCISCVLQLLHLRIQRARNLTCDDTRLLFAFGDGGIVGWSVMWLCWMGVAVCISRNQRKLICRTPSPLLTRKFGQRLGALSRSTFFNHS